MEKKNKFNTQHLIDNKFLQMLHMPFANTVKNW